jgi:hypothetical protein
MNNPIVTQQAEIDQEVKPGRRMTWRGIRFNEEKQILAAKF